MKENDSVSRKSLCVIDQSRDVLSTVRQLTDFEIDQDVNLASNMSIPKSDSI